ncbi:hypothetical protein [Serratia liquefaciens]|uniref:hypothetical protein n=1 Tax=Serratia TaxID=613 RepID=UPI00101F83A4|nr:hypothetical protein [Serratia liquefaciens]
MKNKHNTTLCLAQQALPTDVKDEVLPHQIKINSFDSDSIIDIDIAEKYKTEGNAYLTSRLTQEAKKASAKADTFAVLKHIPGLLGSTIDTGAAAYAAVITGSGYLPFAIKAALLGKDAINALLDYQGRKNQAAGGEDFPGGSDIVKNVLYKTAIMCNASPQQATAWSQHLANYINNSLDVSGVAANRYAPAKVSESMKIAMDLFSLIGKPGFKMIGGMAEAQSTIHAKNEKTIKKYLTSIDTAKVENLDESNKTRNGIIRRRNRRTLSI